MSTWSVVLYCRQAINQSESHTDDRCPAWRATVLISPLSQPACTRDTKTSFPNSQHTCTHTRLLQYCSFVLNHAETINCRNSHHSASSRATRQRFVQYAKLKKAPERGILYQGKSTHTNWRTSLIQKFCTGKFFFSAFKV